MSVSEKNKIFIEKRNKEILKKLNQGFSVTQILNMKDAEGQPLFKSQRGQQINRTTVQKIAKNKTSAAFVIYKEEPVKRESTDLDTLFSNLQNNTDLDFFLEECGYAKDGVKQFGARSRKNYLDGVFYAVRYKDKGVDFIKYGISTSNYVQKRWAIFRATNIRKGVLTKDCTHDVLIHEIFKSYSDVSELELDIKKQFKAFMTKEQIPDGFSETLAFSENTLETLKTKVDSFDSEKA